MPKMTHQTTTGYTFPEDKSEEDQFHYVSTLMDQIESETYGELTFTFNPTFKGFAVEIFEHEEGEEDTWENWNGLELVDWYNCKTIKEVFEFLLERYL